MSQRIIAAITSSLFAAIVMSDTTFGQPVSVSLADGVHVRAPFVSVDVFPGGGVSVRAPYTAVDIGGRPYVVGRPVIVEEQPLPTSQALTSMDDDALWRVLRNASLRLNQRLSRFDTGATWQRYLRLPDELVTGSTADTEARRAAAATMQQRFADVAANPQFRKIADLPAFTFVQAVLAEMNGRPVGSGKATRPNAEELPPPQRNSTSNERSVVIPPQESRP